MRYQLLGRRTGLKVSCIALGTALLGKAAGYGAEPEDVPAILHNYLDAGGNVLDTSDAYQQGAAESALAGIIAPRRSEIVLVSKFGRGASPKLGAAAIGTSRKAIVQSVEDSLRRLKTDRIDVYMAHLDDGITPAEEIAHALDDLVRAGKIVYPGLSNFPAWRVASAVVAADLRGWTSLVAIECEYSLLARDADRELLPMADGFGLAVLGYSALAAGILTAKYRSGARGRATDFPASVAHAAASPANEAVIDELVAVAARLDATPGAVAIAWVASRGIVPIIGPRTPAQLADNLRALEVRLTDTDVQRLDDLSRRPAGYPHELLDKHRPGYLAGVALPRTVVA